MTQGRKVALVWVALMLTLCMGVALGYYGSVMRQAVAEPASNEVVARLTEIQCSPSVAGTCHEYRPLMIGTNAITVDCDHELINCDDEGA